MRYQGMNHEVECVVSPIPSVYIKHLININEEGSQKKICQSREKYYFPDHGSSTRKQIHHQTNANIIFYKFTSFPGDLYLSLCQLFKESFRKI